MCTINRFEQRKVPAVGSPQPIPIPLIVPRRAPTAGASAGHEEVVPSQTSGASQVASMAARHTVPAAAGAQVAASQQERGASTLLSPPAPISVGAHVAPVAS